MTPNEREQADIDEVNFMMSAAIQIQGTEATKAVRLGGRPNNRPRTLLITLSQERNVVLRKEGKIREYEEWLDVYIHPDRTPQEQSEYKNLLAELKTRKSNGETNLIIRDGAITTRSRAQTQQITIDIQSPVQDAELVTSTAENEQQIQTETNEQNRSTDDTSHARFGPSNDRW